MTKITLPAYTTFLLNSVRSSHIINSESTFVTSRKYDCSSRALVDFPLQGKPHIKTSGMISTAFAGHAGVLTVFPSFISRVSQCSFAAKFDRQFSFFAGNSHLLASLRRLSVLSVHCFPRKMPSQIENHKNSGPLLKVVKLTENAILPTKGSKHAAGYDLYSAYDYEVESMGNILVKTDLQVAVPRGCYGRVAPRSGLALKNFIDVGAGVVDEDYRGNLGVVLFNFGKEPFKVKRGERIAQFICERIEYPEIEEVKSLEHTERGIGGFGSTGVN